MVSQCIWNKIQIFCSCMWSLECSRPCLLLQFCYVSYFSLAPLYLFQFQGSIEPWGLCISWPLNLGSLLILFFELWSSSHSDFQIIVKISGHRRHPWPSHPTFYHCLVFTSLNYTVYLRASFYWCLSLAVSSLRTGLYSPCLLQCVWCLAHVWHIEVTQ